MATIELSGKVTNDKGTDLEGLTVQLYTACAWECATCVTATGSTNSDGLWNFDTVAQGNYIVVVNNADSTKKMLFDGRNEVQFKNVDIRSTLQTDTINEATTASGVTIDGVLLKDGSFIFEGATANAHETTLAIIDPTADATINLPAMGAGTYYLPVMAAASTTSIASTPAELNLLDGSAKSTSSITICDADAFVVIDGSTTKQIPASDLSTYIGLMSFQLEDDDGTEVTISNAKEVKIIGSGVTTDWTDTSTGSNCDPYDLTITVDAAQTGITSIYNTSLKAGRDADNLVDFATTDNKIILRVNGVNEVELVENALSPVTSGGVALGTGSLMWSDLFVKSAGVINFNNGDVTLTHSACTLTVSGGTLAAAAITGTTIDATTDFTVGSTVITDDVVTFTPTSSDTVVLTAAANGAFSLVTTDDNAAAANITITADGTVDIESAGVLTLDSGAAINIEPAAGSAVLIDGNVSIDGDAVTGIATLTASGVITAGGFTIGSAAITEAELEILDGATVTTTELNLLDALDRGSILYGNASGVTTVLGQGGADTVLTSDGTDIAWTAAASAAHPLWKSFLL